VHPTAAKPGYLAGRIKTRDRLARRVEHPRLEVGEQAAEADSRLLLDDDDPPSGRGELGGRHQPG
jgi:hypothetical protein